MGSVMDGQDDTNTGSNLESQSEQTLATQLERLDDVLNMYGAQHAPGLKQCGLNLHSRI